VNAALHIVQAILAVFLTVLILLQSRGAGVGSVFGGGDSVFVTRRGVERTLFRFTIGTAIVFLLTSLLVATKLAQ